MDLVVGIGNTLRTDDGVGVRLVESLPLVRGTETLTVHQLTPELAEPVSRASRVLFVDADSVCDAVSLTPLCPSKGGARIGHTLAPEELLMWTAAVYGNCPQAWLLSLPGRSFEFGERLSSEAESVLPSAREVALVWLAQGRASRPGEEEA